MRIENVSLSYSQQQEIAALAARFGADVDDFPIDPQNRNWTNNIKTTSSEYKGKVSTICSIHRNTFYLTIKTFKGGGQSESLKIRLGDESSAKLPDRKSAAWKRALERSQQKREWDEKKKQERLQQTIDDYIAAFPANPNFPYLKRKYVSNQYPSIKEVHDPYQNKAYIQIPMGDAYGNITGMQSIDAGGNKKFTAGSKISGSFHVLGCSLKDLMSKPKIYIMEGAMNACTVSRVSEACASTSHRTGLAGPHPAPRIS